MTRPAIGRWWRSPLVGAAIVASMLMLTACGDEDASEIGEPTTTTGPGTPTTVAATTSSTPVDPVLAEAIAAVGGRYRFTAVVDIDGVVVNRVEGDLYDGIGRYLVTSGDTVIEYVISPDGQWARQGDGPWTVLSGPAQVVDPLTPLGHPIAVTLVSEEAGTATIDATYPPDTLGFAGAENIVVTISIVNGVLAELRYLAMVGSDLATVSTTIDADAEMTPVTIPTL